MRLTLVIIAAFVLAACHRDAIPQTSSTVQKSDSVTVMYFYHDTVVTAAKDSATIHDTIPCPLMNLDYSVYSGRADLTVKAHGGVLDVTCSSDSLRQVIQVMSQKMTELRQEKSDSVTTVIQTVDVPVTHYPALLWYSLGLNILLLIVLYFEISTGSIGDWLSAIFKLISKL